MSVVSLDRPIFLVGHARGGSTALGALLNWHSEVGPKYDPIGDFGNVNEFLKNVLNYKTHLGYSEQLEQKDIWFDYFPGKKLFTHMGDELYVDSCNLTDDQKVQLGQRLTDQFTEKRFLSKAPTNSFRLKAIRSLFPNAKFVAVLRSGEEVVASWGRRPYGFGKKVQWYDFRRYRLSYREGIKIFHKKWLETLNRVEEFHATDEICCVSYQQMIDQPHETLKRIFEFVELGVEDFIYDAELRKSKTPWQSAIPFLYRRSLENKSREGNLRIESLTAHDQKSQS